MFLTPSGETPEAEEDSQKYITYSYESLVQILEIILNTYASSISDVVQRYIRDYVSTLRRTMMKDDEDTEIAKEIYANHKKALDFIFENKPDRMSEVMMAFVEAIEEAGLVPASQSKGYARFLTKALDPVIPHTGAGGFKNHEQFLFEFSYWSKNMTLKTVVAPGNRHNRKILISALSDLHGAIPPRSESWSTIHSHKHAVNINSDKYDELSVLKDDLVAVLQKEAKFIEQVEEAILAVKDEFDRTNLSA